MAFEALLINLGAAESLYDVVFDSGGRWILLLGAFMVVSWLATNAAHDILNRRGSTRACSHWPPPRP